MAKRKTEKKVNVELEGQLTLWDIKITKKPTPFTKIEEKVTENKVSFTKIINEITPKGIEKTANPLKLTEEQQEFLNKNKVMENENLTRVIHYSSGSLGIETMYENSYETIYLNTKGEKEFIIPKETPVLPWDRVLYYKTEFNTNIIQQEKLEKVLDKFRNDIKRVIKRKGDKNILIELPDKVIDILENGWVIDFTSINTVNCSEEEVIKKPVKEKETETEKDPVPAVGRVKVGDYVRAYHGKEVIEGTITREYGLGNEILNIEFDNATKVTAIGRMRVIEILR